MSAISRQEFLRLMAVGGASFLGLATPRIASAQIAAPRGLIAPWSRLKFNCDNAGALDDDDWSVHPNGDLNLLDGIRDQAGINVTRHWHVADVGTLDTMTPFPFLFMHAELPPELSDTDRKNLRDYLLRGGFLFAEDCVIGKGRSHRGKGGDVFFQRMAAELPKIVPEAKFEKLPIDHPVFHAFHHMPDGMPHMQGTPWGLHGLTLNGRVLALLSPSDNHCAWTNGDAWFGHAKQVQAIQMGTNIYIYAMTQTGQTGTGSTGQA